LNCSAQVSSRNTRTRVLDQLIYKWEHSRLAIADALYDSYAGLLRDGRAVTRQEIERDATKLFSGNFRQWVGLGSIGKVEAGAALHTLNI